MTSVITYTASSYRICTRCVMDTSAADIYFDDKGICNYCTDFYHSTDTMQHISGKHRQESLNALLKSIKVDGKDKEYDCILGLSGGLDSSYALFIAKQLGLRPLAVHLDNGWNSELAVSNIEKLVRGLDIDLYTHVIDWEEFRELQLAFFRANVIDIEMLTDHALQAVLYKTAYGRRIKHILAGTNVAGEGMKMPKGWNHTKLDAANIRGIYRKFGSGRHLTSFPVIGLSEYVKCKLLAGISWVSFLDYVPYTKQEAVRLLYEAVGWRTYEKKHYESVFTRFYQGYILPRKFGVDKRRVHYSNLICSGQMTRETALDLLLEGTYEDQGLLKEDREFVLKKLGFSDAEFDAYLTAPAVSHYDYPSYEWLLHKVMGAAHLLRK